LSKGRRILSFLISFSSLQIFSCGFPRDFFFYCEYSEFILLKFTKGIYISLSRLNYWTNRRDWKLGEVKMNGHLVDIDLVDIHLVDIHLVDIHLVDIHLVDIW